jgi:hypothetical protein
VVTQTTFAPRRSWSRWRRLISVNSSSTLIISGNLKVKFGFDCFQNVMYSWIWLKYRSVKLSFSPYLSYAHHHYHNNPLKLSSMSFSDQSATGWNLLRSACTSVYRIL